LRSIPINPKNLASSLLGSRDARFGAFETAEETERKMKEGKTKDGTFSRAEAERASRHDYRRGESDLKAQYGSNWLSRAYKGTSGEYNDAKRKLKDDRTAEEIITDIKSSRVQSNRFGDKDGLFD
jgi:hypothetical protein